MSLSGGADTGLSIAAVAGVMFFLFLIYFLRTSPKPNVGLEILGAELD